jgi:uncharacterized protein YmfQ (DUF2313 family)
MAAMTAEAYRAQLQALLPPGQLVWPRDPNSTLGRLLAAKSDGLAHVDARAKQLIDESLPDSALELLPDWERVVGLPDACSTELANTISERRMAVVAKLTMRGGASRAWFIAFAAKLGYTIEIDEFRPFVPGLARCGDRLNGDHIIRHTWRVRVLGPRYTPFRTGASQCGDLLGKITRAEDLECRLKRANQAHKNLIVSYEGA